MVKVFDNITDIVRDDLQATIKRGSKVSVAAACFSMYAYKELKSHLEQVDEFRFIFTSPTFVQEHAEKQRREVYTFLTARPVYPKGWKYRWKTHYFHALGFVVEWKKSRTINMKL